MVEQILLEAEVVVENIVLAEVVRILGSEELRIVDSVEEERSAAWMAETHHEVFLEEL